MRISALSAVPLLLLVGLAGAQSDASKGLGQLLGGPARSTLHPDLEEIEARIDELSARPGSRQVAAGSLEHAQLALQRARTLFGSGKAAAAERAKQIAWSALSLASRQLAVVDARRARDAALSRAEDAEAEAQRSAEALEVSRRRLRDSEARREP